MTHRQRDLPPTLAVVVVLALVLAFAAILVALGLSAAPVGVGTAIFGGVVAVLATVLRTLPAPRRHPDPEDPARPQPEGLPRPAQTTDPASRGPDTDPGTPTVEEPTS